MAADLALLAADPGALELAGDPGQFVVLACERAKQWLTEALDNGQIDQLVELKSQAEAIRIYTAQKQIGKDAELAAAEVVRRAERGIGVAIRRGQEAGEIRSWESTHEPGYTHVHDDNKVSPAEIAQVDSRSTLQPMYLMAATPDDQFEEAIEEAKAEGNLSRANVVRKVRGEKPQPKNEWHRKRRHLDGNKIIRESILVIEGAASGLRLLDELDDLDDVLVEDWWLDSLTESMSKFRKLRDLLRGMHQ